MLGDGFHFVYIFAFQNFTKHQSLHPLFITKTLLKNQEQSWTILNSIVFVYLRILDFPNWGKNGKDGHRQMMKIFRIIFWKSWRWDQYLSDDINGLFGSMGLIPTRKMKSNCGCLGSIKKSWRSMFETFGAPKLFFCWVQSNPQSLSFWIKHGK